MCIRDRLYSDKAVDKISIHTYLAKERIKDFNLVNGEWSCKSTVSYTHLRKTLPLEDALYYIYSSNLYKALLDENTKLWYSSRCV